jgi:FAD/FMN-containing dehydrogenase
MDNRTPDSDLIEALRARLGPHGVLTDPADTASYCEDWRRLYHGHTPAVLRPMTVAEVADAVRLCAERGVAIVPQGGNTSMVGGAAVSEAGDEIVLSLSRMNRVRTIDPVDMTMEIEAGAALKAAQEAAAEADCLLPLSISSEGSARIGGCWRPMPAATTRCATATPRDLVLGLEVVLPDGQVWNGLRRLHKGQHGVLHRQLFVGSEGTLGIITAAILGFIRRRVRSAVALCAVASRRGCARSVQPPAAARRAAIQARVLSGAGIDFVLRYIPNAALPVATPAQHYALIELATPRQGANLRGSLEELLAAAMEAGTVVDAVIAESGAQRAALWKLREEHSEAQKRAGASVKNDVSVPVSKVPELIRRATDACERLVPGIRCVPFGHLGDGNIHFNLVQPEGGDPDAFSAATTRGWTRSRGRAGTRRQLLGRARHWQAEAVHDAGMARRRRTRSDAAHQGGARPEGADEPGQDAAVARV